MEGEVAGQGCGQPLQAAKFKETFFLRASRKEHSPKDTLILVYRDLCSTTNPQNVR